MHIKLVLPIISRTKLNIRELILLSDELSLMLNAGLPIINTITTILHSAKKNRRLAKICQKILISLHAGYSLEQALSQTKAFPNIYCALVLSGEKSGNLAKNFSFLSLHYQQHLALQQQLLRALAYPTILFCFGLLSAILLTFFLAPKLSATFGSIILPKSTQLLINIMLYFTNNILLILGSLFILGVILRVIYISSSTMQFQCAKIILSVPILRDLLYTINILRYIYILSITFSSGISLLTCLKLANQACTNLYLKQQLGQVSIALKQGSSIYIAFLKTKVLPNTLLQMLAIGEESGTIDLVLNKAATQLNQELQLKLKLLSELLEPIFMLLISLILGFIIYAMYMPLLTLSHNF